MCVAIWNRPNKTLSKETLKLCQDSNPDGMGLLVAVDKKFVVHKSLKNFDWFYGEYKALREKYPEKPIVLHFRMATHGGVSENMCHPFIAGDVGFVHNGVISGMGTEPLKSDTCLFSENILAGLPKGWMDNEFIVHMIAEFIGTNNKLILMNKKGQCIIVNEHMGEEDADGNWFSNGYWKYHRVSYDYSYGYAERTSQWVLNNGVYVHKDTVDKPNIPYRSWD